jgi:cyclopropane-fatty-acyl-phospholipid synthase
MTTLESTMPAIASPVPLAPGRQTLESMLESGRLPCEVELPSGEVDRYGSQPSHFRLRIHDERLMRRRLDEFTIGTAYIEGAFDIEGDVLSAMQVRALLPDGVRPGTRLGFWLNTLLRGALARNRAAIDFHYSLGDDFYLTFIDQRYRFYSHGTFLTDDEGLEQASEHKLERMYEALQLRPGMRLLDIGAGWGGVAEYCGRRGVHVTELTIARDSYDFVRTLIDNAKIPAEVLFEDFLVHEPAQPYDAVVIYGVIEHIPDYRRFCERVWVCLRPGGRLYVDASATREKYRLSGFSRRYIWPGTHSPLCLQEFLQELLLHGMDVVEVINESRDYALTMEHWALRFDEQRAKIVERWGERVYRAFRLYLWGGCWGFRNDRMQAYRVVAQRTVHGGPRPGLPARLLNFSKSLL